MILFLPSSVIQEQCTSDFFNRVNRYTLCILNIDFFHFKILAHEIHQEFAQWSSVSEQLWKDVIWLLTSTLMKYSYCSKIHSSRFFPAKQFWLWHQVNWVGIELRWRFPFKGCRSWEGIGQQTHTQSTAPRSCSCRYVYIQTVRAQKQLCDKQSCLLGNAKRCMYS